MARMSLQLPCTGSPAPLHPGCLATSAGATVRARGAGNVDPTPAIKTVTYNPVV